MSGIVFHFTFRDPVGARDADKFDDTCTVYDY